MVISQDMNSIRRLPDLVNLWDYLSQMVERTDAAIKEITRRLITAAKPRKLILFGSFARGDFGPDSDLDILVIETSVTSKHAEMIRLRKALRGILVPIDVLVISEDDFKERSAHPSNVYYWAAREGKVLYEAA